MKTVLIGIGVLILATALIAWVIIPNEQRETGRETVSNVTVANGEQTIEITAKGGYFPRVTVAKAGIPTTLKMKTRGTFDCSSALVIPSLNYRTSLPPTGETIVALPSQQPGTTIRGLCSMGMYSFTINFN